MQLRPELKIKQYDNFQCIGGACEDTCCAGWKISIDKKSYQNYKKTTNTILKPLLQKNLKRNRKSTNDEDYGLFHVNDEGVCGLLDTEGLCSIQTNSGPEALCTTCSVYPRDLKEINTIVEKTLDLSCPEVARLILLDQNGLEFIQDEAPALLPILGKINHSNQKADYFWTNRSFMITALQSRNITIETRLMYIGLYIRKLYELPVQQRFEQAPLLAENYLKNLQLAGSETIFDAIPANYTMQNTLVSHFFNMDKILSERYVTSVQNMKKNLYIDDSKSTDGEIINHIFNSNYKNEMIAIAFENFLVNLTFTKYVENTNEHLQDFYSEMTIQFTLLRLLILGNCATKPLSEEEIIVIFQSFIKNFTHNSTYVEVGKEILSKNEYEIISQAINVIKL
ncbi:flagellin lysine-N-methylase [Kurthia sibirica]|uniref:Lysine-N-methylase n=1 Tax=Kurthia sibirica TaxID=202750 RepID=A0A2U3AMS2_9BACL|nr:flagellin lysine-N-methylase [Kurthia sibirica]PWI25811.1 hypothetical protein DEX24_06300 [Kurthia sibirica]GEK33629.1 hypothetical protein KSI01_11620 [Kurthia sibirica]